MKSKQSINKIKFALLSLLLMLGFVGCQERKLEDLQPLSFPNTAEVFIDDFTGDLNYAAFGGSDVTAFQVDKEVTYNGSTQSMRFAVPDSDSPSGAFAGGVFFSGSGRNLSGYNALTFFIKATQSATIGELGFGNDLGENKYVTTLAGLSVNTNWQKVIIPIPDPSKLTGEKGLLYYAAGPIDNKGFTFWIDEVKYENLGDLGNVTGVILGGQDQVNDKAETGDKITITGFQATATLPTGVSRTVNASQNYFTFSSSDASVAGVDEKGVVSIVNAGTATITANIGDKTATGSIQITSIGAPVAPTAKATVPATRDAIDVVSLYSNAYTNQTIGTWNTRWQFSTAEESFIQVEGDDVIRYRSLNFVGIEFANPTVNISAMSTMHIDIWTPDPIVAGSEFKIKLIDFGANGVFGGDDDKEHEVTISSASLSSENWVRLDIKLTDFTNLTTRANLAQMVFSGTLPNMYVDNIYFYREPVTPPNGATAPTNDAGDVISVFSDTYTDVAGTDYNPNWGQNTVATQTSIGGNNTLHYANFNYQGIQLGSSQDVSAYRSLHLDYYTTNATTLNVFLISSGPVEKSYSLTVPTSGWNSVDIPLTEFTGTGVSLTDIVQMKFDGGTGGDIYLDNIYFWKLPVVPTTAAPTPTFAAADVLSVFSDAYTDIAGTDFNPNWGQNTAVTQTPIAGNNTLHYANFNYQGTQFASAQDVSGYNYLHLDFYSGDATKLRVFIISPPNEKPYSLTVPTVAGWNSVDIPLTAFPSPVDLTQILQMKFDNEGAAGGANIYLDNIFFRK
ncbi:hypothetical protein BKI52_14450 [marine bacterium AO1-C]|nr:hypothetical protein BKI52_14450 [marine bacterium AO1-C]